MKKEPLIYLSDAFEKAVKEAAQDLAIECLFIIRNKYYSKIYDGLPKVKKGFRNKRLKNKWFRSLACSINNEIRKLKVK